MSTSTVSGSADQIYQERREQSGISARFKSLLENINRVVKRNFGWEQGLTCTSALYITATVSAVVGVTAFVSYHLVKWIFLKIFPHQPPYDVSFFANVMAHFSKQGRITISQESYIISAMNFVRREKQNGNLHTSEIDALISKLSNWDQKFSEPVLFLIKQAYALAFHQLEVAQMMNEFKGVRNLFQEGINRSFDFGCSPEVPTFQMGSQYQKPRFPAYFRSVLLKTWDKALMNQGKFTELLQQIKPAIREVDQALLVTCFEGARREFFRSIQTKTHPYGVDETRCLVSDYNKNLKATVLQTFEDSKKALTRGLVKTADGKFIMLSDLHPLECHSIGFMSLQRSQRFARTQVVFENLSPLDLALYAKQEKGEQPVLVTDMDLNDKERNLEKTTAYLRTNLLHLPEDGFLKEPALLVENASVFRLGLSVGFAFCLPKTCNMLVCQPIDQRRGDLKTYLIHVLTRAKTAAGNNPIVLSDLCCGETRRGGPESRKVAKCLKALLENEFAGVFSKVYIGVEHRASLDAFKSAFRSKD